MEPAIYSLGGTINDFFTSHPTVTRQQCDQLALSLASGPVTPVPIQGSFSYTVMAGTDQSKIIQFRDGESDLDTRILDVARQIHRQIIANYTFHGKIGESLSVYLMENLPGTPYISATLDGPQHSNTVTDYALYVELRGYANLC